jgi:lipopolysaccharide transport system ATP-binding protein
MWIEGGRLRMMGSAAEVTSAYQASLNASIAKAAAIETRLIFAGTPTPAAPRGSGAIRKILATVHGLSGREVDIVSGETDLQITMDFSIDPELPAPSVAFGFSDVNNLTVASVLTVNDGVQLTIDAKGQGRARVLFPRLPLLKGRYTVTGFLACEKALHVYEQVESSLVLNVTQKGMEQGLVKLPHTWQP